MGSIMVQNRSLARHSLSCRRSNPDTKPHSGPDYCVSWRKSGTIPSHLLTFHPTYHALSQKKSQSNFKEHHNGFNVHRLPESRGVCEHEAWLFGGSRNGAEKVG